MANRIHTTVDKKKFMEMPQEEQNYLIFGAVQGHEERICCLERSNRAWIKHPLTLVGGVIGGILAKIGLG